MQLEICANCEEGIAHTPVYHNGEHFCCAGCAAGGPCVCAYGEPAIEPLSIPNPLPERLTATGSLLRFPRPGAQAIVLQIFGLADQRAIIALAAAMESSPVLSDLSLACLADGDAWFTMHAASADAVADVIAQLSAEPLDIIVNQNLVEAHPTAAVTAITPMRAPHGRAGMVDQLPPAAFTRVDIERSANRHNPASYEDQGSVLPPRPWFRVFRPAAPVPADDIMPVSVEQPVIEPAPNLSDDPVEDTADTMPEGVYYIVATQPFRSFSAVNTYHQAVHALEGVTSTHVQRFDRGTLYLAVTYQSEVPLRQRLEALEGYTLEIANETHSKIDVALRTLPLAARAGRA